MDCSTFAQTATEGALPSELQDDEVSFDLVAALDVLEHLESILVRRGVAIPFGLSYAAVFRRRI